MYMNITQLNECLTDVSIEMNKNKKRIIDSREEI